MSDAKKRVEQKVTYIYCPIEQDYVPLAFCKHKCNYRHVCERWK